MSGRFLPRDFVSTSEGLVFAVVDRGADNEPIPCFLRYCASADGRLHKLGTHAANDLLRRRHPQYLFHCRRREADLHGVDPRDVYKHLKPRDRVQFLLDPHSPTDPIEARATRLLTRLATAGVPTSSIGMTGSLLAGSHRPDSDIDLVLYDAAAFDHARNAIPALIDAGTLAALDDEAWGDAYRRRGCSLNYKDFCWHEARKMNKAIFEGTKFDISLVVDRPDPAPIQWRKLGFVRISSTVIDDRESFDYPACLRIAHDQITEVVSFTATYSGQARLGERVEIQGQLEEALNGARRIVVGSDREASGQYIKVIPQ